jgi:hypothetical protein
MRFPRASTWTSKYTCVQILLVAIYMVAATALLISANSAYASSQDPTSTTVNSLSVWPNGGTGFITATVKDVKTGSPITSGVVNFFEGGAPLGSASLASNGTATLYTQLPPGVFYIRAQFQGGNSGAPSRSQEFTIYHTGTTNTALTSNGSLGSYSLIAKVTSNQNTPPSGDVVFMDQTTGTTLGTVALASVGVSSTVTNYQDPRSFPGFFFGNYRGMGPVDYVRMISDQSNPSARDLVLGLMNPDGSFTTKTLQVINPGQYLFGVGDFNNDGFTDLLMLAGSGLSIWLCDGNGKFTQKSTYNNVPGVSDTVTIADFNGDGNADVLITTAIFPTGPGPQLTFIPGDGQGGFVGNGMHVTSTLVNEPFPAADFNSDGNLDILTGPYPFSLPRLVYLGAGDGSTFSPEPDSVFGGYQISSNTQPIVADFNNDGIPDLAYVTFGSTATLMVLAGDGKGNFNLAGATSLGQHTGFPIYPIDINGDGNLDLTVFVNDPQNYAPADRLIELIGDGTGHFTISPEVFPVVNAQPEQYTGLPVPFVFPSLGNPSIASAPPVATSVATLGGSQVQAAAGHKIVAIYQGTNILAQSTSSQIVIQGTSPSIPLTPSFAQGFESGSVQLNGSAKLLAKGIQLTDGQPNETGGFFYPTPVDIRGFVTDFDFQFSNAQADGLTFTIQNVNPNALGGTGGALGYAGIPKSAAIKFDLFDNAGEGSNSTGLYVNGAMPTVPSQPIDAPSRQTRPLVFLHSGDIIHAHITYSNFNQLKMTLTDATVGATQEIDFTIDLQHTVGSGSAYVGFTAATGALTSSANILDWTYAPLPNYVQRDTMQVEQPSMSDSGLILNGGAHILETLHELRLIDSGTADQAHSAYFSTPVDVRKFDTDFMFQPSNAIGDGFTFVLQNAGLNAVGPSGGGLGYGPDTPWGNVGGGIPQSIAMKFDFFNNVGEGKDSIGLYLNGASPTIPAKDLSSTGIVLTNGDVFDVHMVYDGTTLTMTITDTKTGATVTQNYVVNIPQIVGANTALAGFTGGTGALSASEDILNWTYLPMQ